MTDGPLRGSGVLVTRPRQQSAALIDAVDAAGGHALCFPSIEIEPVPTDVVSASAEALGPADIVIFASPNAVEFGLQYAGNAAVGAIGPGTAAAIQAAGHIVDIRPATGYDSESLLGEAALSSVSGTRIQIVRGNDGRKLLGDTLTQRGATVSYLSVYNRRRPNYTASELAVIESNWRGGKIDFVVAMSVVSLQNLIVLLPEWCADQLARVRLVTPATRVIKEALGRYPTSTPVLASGPSAKEMVAAMIDDLETHNTKDSGKTR